MQRDLVTEPSLNYNTYKKLRRRWKNSFGWVFLWLRKLKLKGQCHEIFFFWFFSWISFPPAPEYSFKTVSNFFENSRRYSQLKVCHRCRWHRWQMEKIFNQKNFNNFVWSPLGSRGNIYIKFCLQVHFHVSAAWYCSHYLPPVSMTLVANLPPAANLPPVWLTPVANLPPVSTIQGELVAKFAAGVVDTGGAPWLANISANFRKNSKWFLCYYQGLGGRWFMKKTWGKKSRDTVPLNKTNNPMQIRQSK